MSDDNISLEITEKSSEKSTLELMKTARRWLVWKRLPSEKPEGKSRKVPFYTNGNPRGSGLKLDSPSDVAQLATYQEACDRLVGGGYEGIGFALGYDESFNAFWQGVDLDDMTLSGLGSMANKLPAYVETSPSGNGVHCISLGSQFENIASGTANYAGFEAYSSARFFTFTGVGVLRDDPPVDLLSWSGDQRFSLKRARPEEFIDIWNGEVEETLEEYQVIQLKHAMPKYLSFDDYSDWLDAGFALKRYGRKGREIWDAWSILSNKFDAKRQSATWDSMRNVRSRVEWIFKRMKDNGCDLSELSKLGLELKTEAEKKDLRLVRVYRPETGYGIIKPVEYILDGQIPVGSLTIAGLRGGGKTTMLVSLAAIITGAVSELHPMMPRVKRKVIWITEDDNQIHRIIAAMINTGEIVNESLFDERFILIQAKRSDPEDLAKALGQLGEEEGLLLNAYDRGEYLSQPLIILDTVAATLEIADENSNSDVSRAVAAVRQSIPQASVWFVTHVAKGMGRSDTIREMTARGASALESDVQGNAVLAFEEDLPDKRFLILGKKRVDADKNEITATRFRWSTETSAVWGDRTERVSYVTLEATDQEERTEAVEEARETAETDREMRKIEQAIKNLKDLSNAAQTRGFTGIVIKFGSGDTNGPVEGYERYERIKVAVAMSTAAVFKGREAKADFKAFMKSTFKFDVVNPDIVYIDADAYDISGLEG